MRDPWTRIPWLMLVLGLGFPAGLWLWVAFIRWAIAL